MCTCKSTPIECKYELYKLFWFAPEMHLSYKKSCTHVCFKKCKCLSYQSYSEFAIIKCWAEPSFACSDLIYGMNYCSIIWHLFVSHNDLICFCWSLAKYSWFFAKGGSWHQAFGTISFGYITLWQESHENMHKPCELLVLFSSCGILSVGPRTNDRPLPRQTIPEPHKFTMTSFAKYDISFTQWRLTSSTKPSHIIPQGPHHHLELFKRSPVGFLLKSTGNRPRSWVQD